MMFSLRRDTLMTALLAAAVLFMSGVAQASEITIVKSDHTIEEISKKDLKKILEGKSKTWDDGSTIILVTLKEGPAHEAFLKKYARRVQNNLPTTGGRWSSRVREKCRRHSTRRMSWQRLLPRTQGPLAT